ncbi:MAG: alpha/beta hydrolase [Halieaceae bacterium]|jgi:epsilon-lactone hydrolase|nr:alpha/beta hydrolase [Halieaceae bacterium]
MIRFILGLVLGAAAVGGYFVSQNFKSVAPSALASPESTAAVAAMMETISPHFSTMVTGDVAEQRAMLDEYLYGPFIEEARELYPVHEEPLEINGVYTEVFTPRAGIPPENTERVLINLHGGGFTFGARTEGQLESIPVASVAQMKVISVDYRQGPEHKFPAASEDVAKVYKELLKTHQPGQIGIFGCSAGGLLTAQSVAWFQAHDIPQPGAVGVFCSGAGEFMVGDSIPISTVLNTTLGDDDSMPYFEGASWDDPLVAPVNHPAVMAAFPPTLVISSTRDMALSSALAAHQRLISAGVESELHIYEGLMHYFFMATDVPESRQVFELTARFFDRHLAH